MTGKTSRGRMPALDALRGAAVLLVVAAHVGLPGFRWGGQVGVAVFFTLSGYLITGILLRGQPLRVFYVRRAARLLPALVVLLAVELAVTREPRHVVAAAAYVSNWWAVAGGAPSAISHTWSLAVEEQFYALWPLLFVVAAARGRRLEVAIVALAAWRVFAWRSGWEAEVEWGTVSNALGLMAGAWLAIHRPKPRRWMLPAAATALAATIVATGTTPTVGFLILVPVAIAAAALIITAHRCTAPKWLCWFGGISYGWYLWHQFFINTWGHNASLGERSFLAACGLVVAVASLYLLERPAQQWINASYAQTRASASTLTPRSNAMLCLRDAPGVAALPPRH